MPRRLRSVDMTQVAEWQDGTVRRVDDYLAGEEPLEMRAGNSSLGVTLRTPGDDLELTAGFLFTEGIISRPAQLLPLETDPTDPNLVRVRLAPGVKIDKAKLARRFSAGSACGVCGKASIDDIRKRGVRRPDPASHFSP